MEELIRHQHIRSGEQAVQIRIIGHIRGKLRHEISCIPDCVRKEANQKPSVPLPTVPLVSQTPAELSVATLHGSGTSGYTVPVQFRISSNP